MLRFLLFLTLALRVSAQETMIREVYDPGTDTHVEIVALFTKPSPGGFLPVRVKIANNLKVDRDIRIDFESGSSYPIELKTHSFFDFAAGAGKTVTRDIMVPLSPQGVTYSSNATVVASLSGSLGNANNSISSAFETNQPAVLLSESLFTPNASTLDSEIATKFSSSGGRTEFAGKFDPKQLPDDWLAFSGYDSVIMTDSDWTNVPPGGRNAILSWVRLGGQLLIYAKNTATPSSLELPQEAGFGSVSFPSFLTGSNFARDMVREVMANPNKPQQVSIQNDFSGAWPLQTLFGAQTFRYSLFVAVLIIFAILVGPVNLFVFAKSGQRHKLFITTPIISLGASLVLIGMIIVQDGFGGSGIRRVLMEVRPDAGLNAAYLHQEQFSRTGVMTGSRFKIPTPATFTPVPIAPSRWARFTSGPGSKGIFDLQPTDGKIDANGDWFESRSEQGQVLSAVISTRGRIEKTDTPGTYLSTFEFPIDTIYYLDESQQWQRADGIQAGKRFTFTPVDPSMALAPLITEEKAFSARNKKFFDSVRNRTGHFVALTTHAPGIDTNPAIHWKETRTIITGPVL
ncbi:MAG: hypothetical protein ABIS50_04350 [Luteolibacter sp.]|uniref:hypothetical protein n=1 Tax=Luteolibacter sp. TaxID=1962973 RepID=UPI003263FC32